MSNGEYDGADFPEPDFSNEPWPDDGRPAPEPPGNWFKQTGFKVLLTLAGAVPGLYIVFETGGRNGMTYLGPFVGMATVYALWGWIMGLANGMGAKTYEIVDEHGETPHNH